MSKKVSAQVASTQAPVKATAAAALAKKDQEEEARQAQIAEAADQAAETVAEEQVAEAESGETVEAARTIATVAEEIDASSETLAGVVADAPMMFAQAGGAAAGGAAAGGISTGVIVAGVAVVGAAAASGGSSSSGVAAAGGAAAGGGAAISTVGTTYTLTSDTDVLTGTSLDDTFISDAAGAAAVDQINGGLGSDTLKLYGGTGIADIPTTASIETFDLVDFTTTTDFSNIADLALLKFDNATTAQTFTAGAGVNWDLRGMADSEAITLASTAADTVHNIIVTNMGTIAGAGVTVNANGAAITTVNLTSSGTVAAGTDSDIVLASTGTETAVNLTGSGDLALTVAASVTTMNASAFSGALTLVTGANTGGTTITGGSGADTVTATAAVNYNIDLGDGNDTLITADAAGELTAADTIVGGAGTDTLAIVTAEAENLDDNTAADLAVLARITGFERLRITDGVGTAVNMNNLGYSYLQVTTALAADTTLTVNDGFTIESRLAATSANDYIIAMTNATNAGTTNDTLNIVLNADLTEADNHIFLLDAAGVNIVNIAALDRGTTPADTDGAGNDGYTVTLAGGTAANSASIREVVITGTQAVTITVDAASVGLESINGSAVAATSLGVAGVLTIDGTAHAGTQGLAITGGAGRDVLTGTGLADEIVGGGGNDTLNGLVGADAYTGGAGTDTFAFTAAASYTGGIPSATLRDRITDYAKGADIIDETVGALIVLTDASTSIANAGTAALSLTTGIATFNAADDTLAERITAVEAGLTAGTEATNNIGIFEHGGNTYVFIHDGTAGLANTDGLIELTGVTGITAIDLTTSTGNLILA